MVASNDTMLTHKIRVAHQLAEKLVKYKMGDAVMVFPSSKNIQLAQLVANYLVLPLEFVPCEEINDPGYPGKTIGSICEDVVILNVEANDVPSDYIGHTIQTIQHQLKAEKAVYESISNPIDLKNRVVIVVIDDLSNADSLQACLKTIRKKNPLKVIVAAVEAAHGPARIILSQVDEFISL